MRVRSLGREDPLEKEMATHSSILAWRIPWTEGAWQATVHRFTKWVTEWWTTTIRNLWMKFGKKIVNPLNHNSFSLSCKCTYVHWRKSSKKSTKHLDVQNIKLSNWIVSGSVSCNSQAGKCIRSFEVFPLLKGTWKVMPGVVEELAYCHTFICILIRPPI